MTGSSPSSDRSFIHPWPDPARARPLGCASASPRRTSPDRGCASRIAAIQRKSSDMPHQPLLSGLNLPPAMMPRPACGDLRNWPNVSADAVCRHAKALGAAGEALVDAQLLCFGELAVPVGEFFPFDRLILRVPRPIRVQIKTVILPSTGGYAVEPRKGYRGSPAGMRPYAASDFDLLAVVVLREGVIRYTVEKARRYTIPFSAIDRLRRDPRGSFDAALADLDAARLETLSPDLPAAF